MRLALFEPDIPQNTGTILRLAACMGVGADIIEPCGFVWSDRQLRRAGMDYLDRVDLIRHASWDAYEEARQGRLILLTTKGDCSHVNFAFEEGDTLLLGRESAGVPENVHASADARVRIAMRNGERALNVALAAAMVLGEGLRQINHFSEQV
ncbi:MAG TPA: tRNA methyltransferase [Rhodospirillaceae bacterium]|nr:tRNA methyltransferase [Rhodospirillaceae bacterium]HAA93201.1 tRNA methyltransferase [Rhodospirillaceae bacterium]HAT34069.1 tRNA methyltransferase [Rhodospirillaceae bacterium]